MIYYLLKLIANIEKAALRLPINGGGGEI